MCICKHFRLHADSTYCLKLQNELFRASREVGGIQIVRGRGRGGAGTKFTGGMGISRPQTWNILPFRRAKLVARCTSAGQSNGQRAIGELLLLTIGHKKSPRATSDTPQNLVKLRPWSGPHALMGTLKGKNRHYVS